MTTNRYYLLFTTFCLLAGCGRGYGLQDDQVCGDDLREGSEPCDGSDLAGATCADLNLGGGTLSCTTTCAFDVSGCTLVADCGNGVRELPEACDATDLGGQTCESLGLSEGILACDSSCALETRGCSGSQCGDHLISGDEVCDGMALGAATCESLGFYGGDLACETDCSAHDTDACTGRCGDGVTNGPENCDGEDFEGDSCQARGFYTGSLLCASDCLSVDVNACAGRCGDGVTNGPEACDGEDVGGDTCESHGLAGTLLCLGDCSGIDLTSCGVQGVLITELGLGNPDWVELLNLGGTSVDLSGWRIEWWGIDNNSQPATGMLDLPAYQLDAGARVVVLDEYNGDPMAAPTVDTLNGTITFHVNIWWGAAPGAVALYDATLAVVDFARWGESTTDPPAGTVWADTPDALAGSNSDDVSLSRVPDNTDTNVAGDFCRAAATRGTANGSCFLPAAPGTVLINEVQDAQPTDRVELRNPGSTAVDLQGFSLYATNGTGTWEVLPSFVLGPGQHVAVIDDSTGDAFVDGAGVHVPNLNIAPNAGVVILMDGASDAGVDFVRWGTMNVGPVAPDTWADTPAAIGAFPATPPTPRSLGRASTTDTNQAGDFCFMEVSMGAANTVCVP